MKVKVNQDNSVIYPYSANDLKNDNPNTIFPKVISDELFESFGVFNVIIEDIPSHDSSIETFSTAKTPVLENGVWVIKRTIVPLSPENIQANKDAMNSTIKNELNDIDVSSVRIIREYLASLPDAPQILKDKEADAIAKRAELNL